MSSKFWTVLWFGQLITSSALAQLGSWNILHVRYEAKTGVTIFAEAQLRSLKFYNHFHYYEYKGGISWRLNQHIALTAGGGRYDTYQAGGDFITPKAQAEIRTWVEMGMKNGIGQLNFEHRYRAEQRFTSRGYRNRFRYRLGALLPLYKAKSAPYELFLSSWNEVFLTNRPPYFERNRFFSGLILRKNQYAWHAGFLYQFDYQLTDETGRSFLQVGWQISISDKKEQKGAPVMEEN